MKLRIGLIRCGMTESGRAGRFLGRCDEGLSGQGREELIHYRGEGIYPQVSLVYAGELTRCVESARILYPEVPAILSKGLAPFDYGIFTGKAPTELAMDKQFQQWLEGEEVAQCPQGDHPYTFQARCMRAFRQATDEVAGKGIELAAVITHQSAISAIMRRFTVPRAGYQSWNVAWGRGYLLEYDTRRATAKLLSSI